MPASGQEPGCEIRFRSPQMTTRVLWHPVQLRAGALRVPAAPGRVAGVFGRIGSTLRSWRRRARERDQLARFDERLLADIGLTRTDADFLINKPFWKE